MLEWWMVFTALLIGGPAVAIAWKRTAVKPPERDPNQPVSGSEELQGFLYVAPMVLGWMAGAAGAIGLLCQL